MWLFMDEVGYHSVAFHLSSDLCIVHAVLCPVLRCVEWRAPSPVLGLFGQKYFYVSDMGISIVVVWAKHMAVDSECTK